MNKKKKTIEDRYAFKVMNIGEIYVDPFRLPFLLQLITNLIFQKIFIHSIRDMEDKQVRSSEHRLTSEEAKALVNLSLKPSRKISASDSATVFQLDLTTEQKPTADQEADVGLSLATRVDADINVENNTDTKVKHKKSRFLGKKQ